MSRRKKLTIIIAAIILVLVGLLLFLEFGEQIPTEPEEDKSPIFPFATTSDDFFTERQPTTTVSQKPTEGRRPDLWKISDDPVAGSRWVQENGEPSVRFVKKRTGHVFGADPRTRETRQLTDTSIPQTREAFIGPAGKTVVYQYIDDQNTVRTYVARLQPQSNADMPYTAQGNFLAPNIYELAISPDGNNIFYLRESDKTGVGSVYNTNTKNTREVFVSDVTQWRADFADNSTVTVYTPAADDVSGFAYEISITTGERTRLDDGEGLTIQAGQYDNRLQTTHTNRGFRTTTYTSIKQGSSSEFSVPTFAEKCAWDDKDVFLCGIPQNKPVSSITEWYQGLVTFTDNIAIFNTESGNRDFLLSNKEIDRADADVVDIDVSDNFRYMIFTNRKNGDLWGLRL